MARKKTFWEREIKESYYWMLRQLSTTCFVLAGFSFTALSLFVGFFRDQLATAGTMISLLLICSIIFMVGGEFAREAYHTWEYVVAEASYLFAAGILLMTFTAFVRSLPGIHPIAILIMVLGVLFFIGKTLWDVYVTYRIQ